MAYTVYYPAGCATAVPDHYCNPCETPEYGRVRSVAFIANDFEFTNPSSPTEWQTGIGLKKIIIIPQTNGSYDGGSEVETPGYGDQQTRLVGMNHQLTYNDPNYRLNADFYNALKNSRNFRFAFRTATQVHITQNTVQAIPKNPVGEDITSEVVWSVIVKWAEFDSPVPYDAPTGIFECIDYTGAIV